VTRAQPLDNVLPAASIVDTSMSQQNINAAHAFSSLSGPGTVADALEALKRQLNNPRAGHGNRDRHRS
jgi:hypothetical protein